MKNINKRQKINQNNLFIFQKLNNSTNKTHNDDKLNNNNQIYILNKSTIHYFLKDILLNKNTKSTKNNANNVNNKKSLKKNKK